MEKDSTDVTAGQQQRCGEIIDELADIFQVEAALLKKSGHLIVNGVHVGLLDYGQWDQGQLTVFFDLGPIPAPQSGEVCRQLLEQNLHLPSGFGVFAIIPDNGHVALIYRFEMSPQLSAEALALHICEVSAAHVSLDDLLEQAERSKRNESQQQMVRHRLMNKPMVR